MLPQSLALHARPAARFVSEANRFRCAIVVIANGRQANAKSILDVLSLGAIGGTKLQLTASGEDAVAAVTQLAALVASWERAEQTGYEGEDLLDRGSG